MKDGICTIIAAKNAAATIGTAVASALADDLVTEVVVVDDGSTDATGEAAHRADDGSNRLLVIRQEVNRGPSHARNLAISRSASPLIAILDADDFFLPGRCRAILDAPDWDIAADNIVFLDQTRLEAAGMPALRQFPAEASALSLPRFVEGNISKRNQKRGELGFLKPLIRRDFLDRHGLRYNEDLRLGEDYDLYLRALAAGARFVVTRHCGYGAVIRADSLSGRHATADLKALADAERDLIARGVFSGEALASVRRHERHVRGKYHHRQFLDIRTGPFDRLGYLLRRPDAIWPVATGIFFDKTAGLWAKDEGAAPPPARHPSHYLFETD